MGNSSRDMRLLNVRQTFWRFSGISGANYRASCLGGFLNFFLILRREAAARSNRKLQTAIDLPVSRMLKGHLLVN